MFKLMIHAITMLLFSMNLHASNFPSSYHATYKVSRGGKVIAEQVTDFKNNSSGNYTLNDITTGTHGLASFTGFERVETTEFNVQNNQVSVIKHKMQQKVTFKKKKYQFSTTPDNDVIKGEDKKPFNIKSSNKPISSHLIALWLSAEVCNGKKHITVPVLKSKRIKNYSFNVYEESSDLYRVKRVYPSESNRSSEIWLNKNLQCLAVKTKHQEVDEPTIETKLFSHSFK